MFLPLVPGQALAKEYFERALRRGQLAHAYLFVGPEGAGKRLFAHELAKVLFCASGNACGECTACRSVEHGNHPSVEFYGPAEGRAIIDVDTIRSLCERLFFKAYGAHIAVLEQAELLNEPAANALLKTLEEPPGSALIILTAQSAGSLAPTIVSRCHRIFFTGSRAGAATLPPAFQENIEDVSLPGFFARQDPSRWLAQAAPEGEGGARNQLRRLLGVLAEEWRGKLPGLEAGPLDDALRRIALFLELRQDVDRNIHPELVLEKLIADLMRPA